MRPEARLSDAGRPPPADRNRPSRRGAGPPRPRTGRGASGRPPSAGEARRGSKRDPEPGPNVLHRKPTTRSWPRPAPSWSAFASRPSPRSRPRRSAPWPTCGRRSPAWPSTPQRGWSANRWTVRGSESWSRFLRESAAASRRNLMARAGTAARRYAEAVFELADRDKALDRWRDDLRTGVVLVGDPQVERVTHRNPMVALTEREALVERLLAKRVSPAVLNLVRLLTRRSTLSLLPAIANEYQRLLNLRRGIVSAIVTSATALTKDEDTAIRARVAKMTGATVGSDRRGSGPDRRPDRPHRRPAHRCQRAGPSRAASRTVIDGDPGRQAEPAAGPAFDRRTHGHSLRRDHQHHQVGNRGLRREDGDPQRRARSSRWATASPRSTASPAPWPRSSWSSRAASWAWP